MYSMGKLSLRLTVPARLAAASAIKPMKATREGNLVAIAAGLART